MKLLVLLPPVVYIEKLFSKPEFWVHTTGTRWQQLSQRGYFFCDSWVQVNGVWSMSVKLSYNQAHTHYYLNRKCYANVIINVYTLCNTPWLALIALMPVALCQYYYNQQSDIISQYAVYILDLALVQMCGYKCLCWTSCWQLVTGSLHQLAAGSDITQYSCTLHRWHVLRVAATSSLIPPSLLPLTDPLCRKN